MSDRSAVHAAEENSEWLAIARGLRQRDIRTVQMLVERHQQRLVRYLIYLLARREGVDDLVQETWLRVLQRGDTFDGSARFEPWLFTIARNLAFDQSRKRPTVSLDADDDTGLSQASIASNAPSPFLLAAQSQDATRLASTMQQLSPLYREVLVLRFQDDLSLQEIATVVNASVSTVASRIYRGLAMLRTQLGDAK